MKTGSAAATVVALSLTVAPDAPAQVLPGRAWAPAPAIGGPAHRSSAHPPPYNYYAARPRPARGYVPYGPGDAFPFHGRPYGHPYDPWTWPHLGGGDSRYLARYYYPPVP